MTSEQRREEESRSDCSLEKQPTAVQSNKHSIQEVTHESPPHNSHVATLKLQGPPILPWKLYKHYIGKKLTEE